MATLADLKGSGDSGKHRVSFVNAGDYHDAEIIGEPFKRQQQGPNPKTKRWEGKNMVKLEGETKYKMLLDSELPADGVENSFQIKDIVIPVRLLANGVETEFVYGSQWDQDSLFDAIALAGGSILPGYGIRKTFLRLDGKKKIYNTQLAVPDAE